MPCRIAANRNAFLGGLTEQEAVLDPRFTGACEALHDCAVRRQALTPAVRELIGLALHAAVSPLHLPAIERHTLAALGAGASRKEILEVLQLASVLGVQTITEGLPIVLGHFGISTDGVLNARQQRLKEQFIRRRGGWTNRWNCLLQTDEAFFEAYTDFSSVPWENEPALPAKVREFIYVAIDGSTAHLFMPGLSAHAKPAIHHGATLDEQLEVIEWTALIGMQTYASGVAALLKADGAGSAD